MRFTKTLVITMLLSSFFSLSSCDTEGCTDPKAGNYDAKADSDDGNCRYDADPFRGKWDWYDSIQAGPGQNTFIYNDLRLMDIRVFENDRSRVQLFWKNGDGSLSDTIFATAQPYTLSIPEQPFEDSLVIQGNFILNPLDTLIETEYRLTRANGIVQYRGAAFFRD